MIILDTVNKSIEMVLSAAVATTQWAFYTAYVDIVPATPSVTPAANDGTSNSTTNQTIIAAPAASTARQVKMISIVNKDTSLGTVTVQLLSTATRRTLINVPLYPNEELTFIDGAGWMIFDVNGAVKTIGTAGRSAGLKYNFNSSTTISAVGTGEIRFDNATLSSIANFGIRLNVDADSNDNTTFIESWDDSTTTAHRGYVHVYKDGDPTKFVILDITGALTLGVSGGTDISAQFPVTPVAWSTAGFATSDVLRVVFIRTGNIGATGATGVQGTYGGAVTLDYLWDTGTSDADPGAGKIRGNNATTASITFLYIDLVDQNAQTQTTLIDTFDASTSTTKARIRLVKKTDVTKWMMFTMTTRTTATGYRKLAVVQVSQSGASPFANGDEILIDLDFTGDIGATGATGATGGTREHTQASAATVTPNADTTDIETITAQAAALTLGAPTGTPVQGQKLLIRIKDNATARGITWNAIYRASSDLALPTTTVISKTMYCGFVYNATDTKWDFIAFLNNI
jgi:hypothetical protein